MSSLVHYIRFYGGEGRESLTKLLDDKDQIQHIDSTIAIGVWDGFAETVGDLEQI